MARMGRDQFHAVVTDPPYGLGKEPNAVEVMDSWIKRGYYEATGSGFMGKEWDAFVPQPATWQECVRVMRPGAHMLCFAGTRTLDWMGISLRFAGLECRDLVMYCYGSGYPKGRDISKAIDKELGAERGKQRTPMSKNGNVWMDKIGETRPWKEAAKELGYHEHDDDNPVTDEAKRWHGWNTSLKPALEPIILARKPMTGSLARNVIDRACGVLNVDACRIGTTGADVTRLIQSKSSSGSGVYNFNSGEAGSLSMDGGFKRTHKDGRWPANLIHDGSSEVTDLFPERKSSSGMMTLPKSPGDCLGMSHGPCSAKMTMRGFDDSGSAARFFYTVKADDDDRPHGKGKHVTTHPTVKPLDLMQYLVRLVCVRGGTVLDPFMGSGSTGCAAILEGMRFVGVEKSQEYADIAVGRLKLTLANKPAEDAPDAPAPPSYSKTDSTPVPRRLRS